MDHSDRDEVHARWKDSLTQAAARAYEAAHGNPIPDERQGSRWRIEPRVAVSVAVAAVVLSALVVWSLWPAPTVEVAEVSPQASSAPATLVVVHVAGQVRDAGLRELPANARVADAVEAAGGFAEEADESAVNLARPVMDGEQIFVPHRDAPAGQGPVNLNRADVATLEELPGIGPVLAERIVVDREANGPFPSVAQLVRVSGVGESVVEQLADLATV